MEAAEPLAPPPASVCGGLLPETEVVYWRPRVDAQRLRRASLLWTLTTVAHVVPFAAAGIMLLYVAPVTAPLALILLAHAWIIPELYAARGANVVRPVPRRHASGPEAVSIGLLGDLVDHAAREHHAETGLVPEPGRLGLWFVGEQGALLVQRGGKRVICYCVRVNGDLPSGDRTAHLLLALRSDEQGFATVANLAFSGARWRIRRRLRPAMRPALDRDRLRAAP